MTTQKGRPTLRKLNYWANQVNQFDPTQYQTEQEYHNVFEDSHPKTWGKVSQRVKAFVSDHYAAYGANGTDSDRTAFGDKYKAVLGPVAAVPHHESDKKTSQAIKHAMQEININRGKTPTVNPVQSFAVDSLDPPKGEDRERRLYNDLTGDDDTGAAPKDQKMVEHRDDMKTTESKLQVDGAKDYAERPQDTKGIMEDDLAFWNQHKQQFKAYGQQASVWKNLYRGIPFGSDSDGNSQPADSDDAIQTIRKKYDLSNGHGQFDKMMQLSTKYGIGDDGLKEYDVMDSFPGDSDHLKLNDMMKEISKNHALSIQKINKIGYRMKDNHSLKGLASRETASTVRKYYSGAGEADKVLEWMKKFNITNPHTATNDLDQIVSTGETGPSDEDDTRPVTVDGEGKVVDEDPDKAYFNERAKRSIVIGGHQFDDPVNTIRPDYGIAGGDVVVPSKNRQITSDVIYDMFSVVPPGYGNGDDNKMYLQQQSWERYVKHGGDMFGPNAFAGPTAGVHPMPMAWRRNKPQTYIDQQQDGHGKLQATAQTLNQAYTISERTAGALPSDIGAYRALTSKRLGRPPGGCLEPVVNNGATFRPSFDGPGYKRVEKRRRLYDPVRHPWAKPRDSQGIGQHLPYGLAFQEILK